MHLDAPPLAIERGRPPPRFRVAWPRQGGMALFAEFAHFVLDFADVELLHPAAAPRLAALERPRLARLRAQLRDASERGFWLAPGAPDPCAYLQPDFTAPLRELGKHAAGPRCFSLCDPGQDPLLLALTGVLALPEHLASRPSQRRSASSSARG